MGKIKFTLTYIIFYLAAIFSCFLLENLALFTANPMMGLSFNQAFALSFLSLLFLFVYFYFEHKYNRLTCDKVLLPLIACVSLILILTILWQDSRQFTNPNDGSVVFLSLTNKDKYIGCMQVIVGACLIYGLLFTINRYFFHQKILHLITLIFVFLVLICSFIDIVFEFNVIKDIFEGVPGVDGLSFIAHNGNFWSAIIMFAFLSAMILNLKKFNVIYFALMVYFCLFNILTTCTTTIFISVVALIIYSLYEIICLMKRHFRLGIIALLIYVFVIVLTVCGFVLFVHIGNNMFAHFWEFISSNVLAKDYATFSSRTTIWSAAFKLLSNRPIDFIFGLGHLTANKIFSLYYATSLNSVFFPRSAHNGFVEIFLRYGLFGFILYIGSLIYFIYKIIQLIKYKKIRFAFLYSLAFLSIIAYSFVESTMFFSFDTTGLYLTLIFFIPVITALKKDKNKQNIQSESMQNIYQSSELNKFISLFMIVLSLSFLFALSIAKGSLVLKIIYLSLFVFCLFFLSFSFSKKSFSSLLSSGLPLTITFVVVLILCKIINQVMYLEAYISLLLPITTVVLYLLNLTLFNQTQQCLVFYYISDRFLVRLLKLYQRGLK